MYRRVAAAAALAVAGLTAGAPMASAATTPTHASGQTTASDERSPRDPKDPIPANSGNVDVLNGLNVLPVQACGLGIPILSGVLDAPDASCSVDNDAAQHN